MNRRWLAGHLPDAAEIRRRLGLLDDRSGPRGWLATTLREPALWCPTRHSIAGGVATGLFVSWMPLPLQMLLAAVLASALRVHVPVSVVMVWFTNPLTIAPLLYAAWRTGSMLLGEPVRAMPPAAGTDALLARVGELWPALFAGCLFWAATSAVTGFVATRLIWRALAVRRWRRRRRNRRDPAASPPPRRP